METERIALSQRERDRLKVLHEVKQKRLTQVAAAKRLKVTDRQVRRMLLRIRERGCRRKMRMSGLCKVEMSAFMVGRGPHGNGAHRLEPTRTGPIESVARGKAKASDAGSCSQAVESNRPPGAADAAPHSRARGWCPSSWTTRPAIEPQVGGPVRAH